MEMAWRSYDLIPAVNIYNFTSNLSDRTFDDEMEWASDSYSEYDIIGVSVLHSDLFRSV